jgi:DNA polymerase-3 subunit delta
LRRTWPGPCTTRSSGSTSRKIPGRPGRTTLRSVSGKSRGARDTAGLLRALERGEVAPVYYLYGDTPRLREEVLSALQKVLFGGAEGGEAFNVDRLDASERSAQEIVDTANQLPVLAARRLVVVRGAEQIFKPRPGRETAGGDGEDAADPLLSYFRKPSASTCLVLIGEKPDARLRATLAEAGIFCDLSPPKDHALVAWLQEEARRLGKRLRHDAASTLVAFTGNALEAAAGELEKLALFVGEREEITSADVEEAVKNREGALVWRFTDALKARDAQGALKALDRYLRGFRRPEEALFPLLGTLRGELRLLLQAQEIGAVRRLRGRALARKLEEELKVHEYRAKMAAAAAERFSRAEIRDALRGLLVTDRRLKSRPLSPRLLLDAWVWRFCGDRGRGLPRARVPGR